MKPAALILGLFLAAALDSGLAMAQSCDDFDECTTNDMCADGMCLGTPRNGGTCDDGNDCTVNDTCVAGMCRGTAAASGTSCNQGCGSCFSQLGFAFCLPDEGSTGNACNDGSLCTVNDRCQFGVCFGDFKCQGSGGGACDFRACNPANGACSDVTFNPCGDCATCQPNDNQDPNNPLPFQCEPAFNGQTCDDGNECTADGTCQQGDCVGAPPVNPNDPTPTASATVPAANTPTATMPPANTPTSAPTSTPTQGAVLTPTATVPASGCPGDCSGDNQVTVDEIVTGVNIALGSLPVSNCPAMDDGGDGEVTVDEILRAINAALNGCG